MRKITITLPDELFSYIEDERISLSRYLQQQITDEIVKKGNNSIQKYKIRLFKYNIHKKRKGLGRNFE